MFTARFFAGRYFTRDYFPATAADAAAAPPPSVNDVIYFAYQVNDRVG